MNLRPLVVLATLLVFVLPERSVAALDVQIVGNEAFAQGDYVEIGVNQYGYFGANGTVPAGYHSSRIGGRFGFISNPLQNGWSEYDGDFFTPGNPAEGFGFSINGTEQHNNGDPTEQITGGSITGVDTGVLAGHNIANIYWSATDSGLQIDRTITISEDSFFILMTVTLTNISGGTLNNVFWSHEVDPDNNQTIGATYVTENSVTSQPGAYGGQIDLNDRAIVLAHQDPEGAPDDTDGSDLYLLAVDSRARVIRKTNGLTIKDADGLWNGTANNSIQTLGTSTDDAAIGIAFNLGNLADNDVVTMRYAYNPASDNTDILDIFSLSTDYGDAPDSYGTTEASGNPAKHQYVSGLFLGTRPSGDGDGFVDGTDDSAGAATDDSDDDGVASFPVINTDSTTYTIAVDSTNLTNLNSDGGEAGSVIAWIDFDGNGTFEADEASAIGALPTVSTNATVNLTWSNIGTANDINFGNTYVRLRVASNSEGLGATSFNAAFNSGEIEDYALSIAAGGAGDAVSISTGAGFLNLADSSGSRTVSGISASVDGQTLTLDVQGISLAGEPYTTTVAAGGAWSIIIPALDVAALSDATTYVLDASVGSATDNDNLIVDLTAPAAPVVFPPTNQKTFAATAPTIVGTMTPSAGESMTVSISGETFYVSPDAGGNWSLDLVTAVSILGNTVTLVDGNTYSVVATVTDQAGNASVDASSNEVVIDSSAILIDINDIAIDNAINKAEAAGTIVVSGTTTAISPGELVTIKVKDASSTEVFTDSTASVQADGSWSLSILTAEVSTWADEYHTMTADVSEGASPAPQVSQVLDVDTSDPTLSFSGAASAINSITPFIVSILFNEDVQNFGESDLSVVGGSIQVSSWSKTNDASYVATIVPTGGVDVVLSVAVAAAQDQVGNDNVLNSFAATWDVSAPSAATCTVTPNPANNGTALTATCTGVETGGSVSIPNYVCAAESGNEVVCTATAGTGGGQVSGDATATTGDIAGNTATSTASLTLDNTDPVVTINALLVANDANKGSYAVSGTCTTGDGNVSVTITGLAPQAPACSAGTWGVINFDVSGLSDGPTAIEVNASQTDTAGNVGNASQLQAVKDVAAPSAATCTVTPNPANNGTAITATCTGVETGGSVSIPNYVCAAESGNEVVCTATAGTGGGQISGDATASAGDAAGNTATSTASFTLDNTDPVVAINALVVANDANKSSYPVSGTCTTGDGNVTVTVTGLASQTPACSAGTWGVINFDVSGLGDGPTAIEVNASQTDAAGNVGNASQLQAVKDVAAPSAATCTVTPNPANNGTAITATCTGVETGGSVSIPNYVCAAESGNEVVCTATAGTGGGQVSGDATATAGDAAGNTTTSTASMSLDNTDPVVTINSISPANNSNQASYPVSGTCTVGDGNVSVTVTGLAPQAPACSAGTWGVINFNVSGLGDGPTAIEVNASQTDSAGNVGNAVQLQEEKDVSAPAVPTVSTQTTNDTTPTIGGTAEANISLSIVVGGATYNITTPGSGNWTLDTGSAFPDAGVFAPNVNGANDVALTSTDGAGNSTNDLSANEITIDTTDPVVVISALSVANEGNESTYPVGGTCTTGDGNVTVTVAGITPQGVACTLGSWTSSFDVSGILDGINAITANASQTDAASNTGDAAQQQADKDTGAPTVGIDALGVANNANKASYPVSGTCTTGDGSVTVTITGLAPQAPACSAGTWGVINFDVSGLSDGPTAIEVNASQTDTAGNEGNASQLQAVKDVAAPSAATCTVTPNPANNGTAITATCTGVETGGSVSIPNYVCAAESGNEVVCTATAGTGGGQISGDATASAGDAAGNTATSTASFTLDNTDPVVAINALAVANDANKLTYPVSGTCTAGDGNVTVTVTGLASQTPACSAGTWGVINFDVSGLGDGPTAIEVNASQTDAAGNVGNASQLQAIKDVAAPSAATCTVTPNPANNGTAITATCTGVETGGSVSIPNYVCAAESGNEVVCTATAGTGGGQVSGSATATASDPAGNTATSTASFTLDNTPPSAASCTVTPNPANNGTAITATCTGVETGGSVSIPNYVCAAESGNEVVCSATAGTGGGQIAGNATATTGDAAGNTSTSSASFTLDNTDPVVAINTLAAANDANKSTYPVSGTCTTGDGNVTVTVTGLASQTPACSAGTWGVINFDVSGLSDGPAAIEVNASQTDAAGNVGNASQLQALKDIVAPSAAACTVTPNPANDDTAITATCTGVETGGSVSIPNYVCAAESGNEVVCTATAGTGGGQVSGDATATAGDAAGNTATSSASFTLDNSDPVVAINALAVANDANKSTYPVSGTCTAGDGNVTVTITGLASQTPACSAGTWGVINFDVSGLGDGPTAIEVNASQTDTAGNVGNASQLQAVKDVAAPSAATCTVTPNPANDGTVITATCTGVETGGSVSIPNYVCAAESGNEVVCTATAGTGGGQISGDATATTGDAAGNTTTSTASFALDNADPVVAINALAVANDANKSTYPVSGTCTTGDGNVTVTITGLASQAPACSAGTWGVINFDVSGLGDGPTAIEVNASQTDAAGNVGNALQVQAVKDVAAPSAATCTVSPDPAQSGVALTATCTGVETGGSVSIPNYVCAAESGNEVVCTATAGSGGGQVSGDATATTSDVSGNTTPSTASFTLDDTDPVVAINALAVANDANKSNYAVSGTCTTGDGNVTVIITGLASQTPACSAGTWGVINFDVSGLSDGPTAIEVNASQTDAAGNVGNALQLQSLKDILAPSAATCTVTPNPANNGTAITATCTGVETGGSVSIPNYVCAAESGNEVVCTATAGTGGGQVSGDATATASDAAGNTATSSASFTLDNTPPAAATCTVTPNPANDGTAITANCTGVETGGSISIPNYICAAESGNEVVCSATAGTGGGQVSGDATATAADAAGNTATSTASFTLDNTDPVVAINALVVANDANKSTYPVSGTCTTGDGNVTVTVTGLASQAPACSAGTWGVINFDVSGLGDGPTAIEVNASQTDAAGNVGSASQLQEMKDVLAPSAATCTVSPDPAQSGAALTATCTGVETGGSVSIPNYVCAAESGNEVVCTATAGTGIGEVSGPATATTTDPAGNTATSGTPFTLDDLAPTVSIDAISTANSVNGTAYPVSGTCNTGDGNVTVTITGLAPQTPACSAGTWGVINFDVSGLTDGPTAITVNASQTDAAANVGNAPQLQAEKNAAAPAAASCVVTPNPAQSGTALTANCTGVETGGGVTIPNYVCAAESGNEVTCTANAGTGGGQVSGDETATTNDSDSNTSTSPVSFTLDDTDPVLSINALTVANNANQATYALSGTCTTGDGNVTVSVAGLVSQTPACVAGNWGPINFDLSGISDGLGVIVADASQTDAAGNEGNAAQQQADKDIAAPSSATCTVAPSPAQSGTALTATCTGVETGGSVSVPNYVCAAESGNEVVCTATSGSAGGQVPGDATATTGDAAGNTSTSTAAFVLDDTPPAVPTVASQTTNDVTPVLTGTAEANSDLVIIIAGATYNLTTPGSGNWSLDTGSVAPNAGAFAPNLNGDNEVAVSSTDAAGNNSADVTNNEVTIDTTDPAVPTITAQTTNDTTPEIAGTAEANSNLSVVFGGATYNLVVPGSGNWVLDTGVVIPDSGIFAPDVNGSNEVVVTSTDAAGNASSDASSNEIEIDTTDPVPPTVGAQNTNDTSPVISGTAEAGSDLNIVFAGATYDVVVPGSGNWSLDTGSAVPSSGSFSPEVNGLNEVALTSTDGAGNTRNDATTNEINIDTTDPVTPTVTSQIGNNVLPTIAGTAEANSSLSIVFAGATYVITVPGSGNWTLDTATAIPNAGTFAPEVNGTNEVALTSTDAAGNSAVDVTASEIEIDTTDPVAPTVATFSTNDTTPTIGGAGESGASLTIVFGGATYSLVIPGSGNWTLDTGAAIPDSGIFAPDVNGDNEVSLTSSDPAGNTSVDVTTDEITIDTTDPVTPTVDAQNTNDTTPTITGTAEANSNLSIVVGGATYNMLASGLGTWSLDTGVIVPDSGAFSPDVNNSNEVVVTSTDDVGNNSVDLTAGEIVIDTLDPVSPVVIPMLTNDVTPTLTGTAEISSQLTIVFAGATYNTIATLSGNWSLDTGVVIPTSGTLNPDVNGTNEVDVTSSDAAGNSASDTSSNEITIDTSRPTPIVATTEGSPTTNTTIPVTVDFGETVTGLLQAEIIVVGASLVGFSDDGAGQFSFDLNASVDGTITVDIAAGVAADSLGNTNKVSTTLSLVFGLDSDGDGLTDTQEGGLGTDPSKPDSDGDGIPDLVELGDPGNPRDTDGDGIIDAIDSDDDNDGISSLIEIGIDPLNPTDSDGTGKPDYLDIDSDDDDILDFIEGNVDSDKDGIPNYLDLDSDADGLSDSDESDILLGDPVVDIDGNGVDSDNDGINDAYDVDILDGDDLNLNGIDDSQEPVDTDSDNTADYLDYDSDEDGIPDFYEGDRNDDDVPDDSEVGIGGVGSTPDGLPDYVDIDSDNDGISDAIEGAGNFLEPLGTDSDDDGIDDAHDVDVTLGADLNSNGVDDAQEPVDTDKDGTADYLDIDSDNDGVPDALEAGSGITPFDSDGDSVPDYLDLDSDNDGLPDAYDSGVSGVDTDGDGFDDDFDTDETGGADANNDGIDDSYVLLDSDGDGLPDFTDRDADNDGLADSVEADVSGNDSDGDGIDDDFDVDFTLGNDINGDNVDDDVTAVDTDGDGLPDYRDLDSDHDSIPDSIESGVVIDENEDGLSDGGVIATEPPVNSDGLDAPDYQDTDSNNDGIYDLPSVFEDVDQSPVDGAIDSSEPDTDQDGIADIADANPYSFGSDLDTDGDGVPAYLDEDDDNDGIPDSVEGGPDGDGDGFPDNPPDSDNDGIPDYLDPDSDNDGIVDAIETGGSDDDEDGQMDGTVLPDGSVSPGVSGQPNNDDDALPDYLDDDSDDDGIPDSEEGAEDSDGDGLPDYIDEDSDDDGLPDSEEGNDDSDDDGLPDYLDEDSDDDGIPDSEEGSDDEDQDGVPNYLDDDSDGDGIPDEEEGSEDSDGDSIPDFLDDDSDGDGIPDEEEGTQDSDGDGEPDYLDDDSDGDGIPDADEGSDDADGDGVPNYLDEDSDGDGIDDNTEGSNDNDGDGEPDYLDEDSDDDGILDSIEGDIDHDDDGIPDYLDTDSDGDGIDDSDEGNEDFDGDGVPNYLDGDSDGDGFDDIVEAQLDSALDSEGGFETATTALGRIDWLAFVLLSITLMFRRGIKIKLMTVSSISLVVSTFFTASVSANETFSGKKTFEPYFYGGAGLAYTFVNPENEGAQLLSVSDDRDTGYRLHAGYHWKPLWSFDILYADLGEATIQQNFAPVQDIGGVTYKVPAIHANFHVEQDYVKASIFTKGGIALLSTGRTNSIIPINEKHNIQIMTGIGAVKYFEHDWGLRADLDFFSRDAALIAIGIQKAFRPKAKVVVPPPPKDGDNDGVIDENDQCLDTLPGVAVDIVGCDIPPVPTVKEVVEKALAVIDLSNVNFEVNSDQLTSDSKAILDKAAVVLNENPSVLLQVFAHTDSDGSAKYNLKLSEKRAQSVKVYLVDAGIAADRIEAEGFGETAPIADNATKEGKAENRRVEFKVIQETPEVELAPDESSVQEGESEIGGEVENDVGSDVESEMESEDVSQTESDSQENVESPVEEKVEGVEEEKVKDSTEDNAEGSKEEKTEDASEEKSAESSGTVSEE